MIKKLSIEDIPQLITVARQTFEETYPAIFNRNQFDEYFETTFTKSVFTKDIETGANHYFGFFENEKLLGFSKLTDDQYMLNDAMKPKFDYQNSIYLDKLYILKSAHKKGIGKQLLNTSKAFAKELGKASIWLRVWSGNENALAFYKKLEWKIIGDQYFCFEGVNELDYVLFKEL